MVQTNAHPFLADTPYAHAPVSYMSVAMIEPEYRGHHLYDRMNTQRFTTAFTNRDQLIMVRTQNPKVETGLRHALDRAIAIGAIKGYNLVVRKKMSGVYGEMLTNTRPRVDDPEIQAEFDKLDYDAGDSYVIGFELTYP